MFTDSARALVVILWSGEDTTSILCGFTITGGHGTLVTELNLYENMRRERDISGGRICFMGGNAIIEHNIILNNILDVKALSVGAGIIYENDSIEEPFEYVIIRGNVISGNKAFSPYDKGLGGGVGLSWGYIKDVLQINNNVICNNYVDGKGGGLYSFSK